MTKYIYLSSKILMKITKNFPQQNMGQDTGVLYHSI